MSLYDNGRRTVVCFGRMNPPSLGHCKLAKKMNDFAIALGGHAVIYLSHSYDGVDSKKPKRSKAKNPLKYEDKLKFCNDAFKEFDRVHVVRAGKHVGNLYQVMHELWQYSEDNDSIYLMCGDDRKDEFNTIKDYNGRGAMTDDGYFKFKQLEVLSAGAREGDTDEENASASLLRQCVKDLDYDKFERFAGTKSLTVDMFETLCKEMGIDLE